MFSSPTWTLNISEVGSPGVVRGFDLAYVHLLRSYVANLSSQVTRDQTINQYQRSGFGAQSAARPVQKRLDHAVLHCAGRWSVVLCCALLYRRDCTALGCAVLCCARMKTLQPESSETDIWQH